jgi:Protein of unknown function (DUF1573)
MKRLSLSATVGACTLLITATARAELHCDQPAVQTGEVHSGASLTHRFALVNNGTETVEILDIKPSCGCLTPRVTQRVFAPGERGVLLLEINTLTQDAGLQSWRATVRYREGHEDHELALQVAATIVTQVSVTPPALVLYTTSAIEHELTLTDRRPTPMTVTAVQPTSPHLRSRLGDWQRNDEGHSVRTIALEVLPEFPEGRHEETIQIFTSDPEYRELRIPVTIVKRARQTVSASPDAVSLSTAASEPMPSRTVLLRSAEDQAVIVERVESDSAAVRCETAAGPGLRATLKIQIDRAKVTGETLQAKVRVVLRQPAGQTVTVPVTWSQR